MSNLPTSIFDKKTLTTCMNALLDPSRADMKAKPDMAWIIPMVKDALFEEAFRAAKGNQSKAARMLGLNRNTYIQHLKRINAK